MNTLKSAGNFLRGDAVLLGPDDRRVVEAVQFLDEWTVRVHFFGDPNWAVFAATDRLMVDRRVS